MKLLNWLYGFGNLIAGAQSRLDVILEKKSCLDITRDLGHRNKGTQFAVRNLNIIIFCTNTIVVR